MLEIAYEKADSESFTSYLGTVNKKVQHSSKKYSLYMDIVQINLSLFHENSRHTVDIGHRYIQVSKKELGLIAMSKYQDCEHVFHMIQAIEALKVLYRSDLFAEDTIIKSFVNTIINFAKLYLCFPVATTDSIISVLQYKVKEAYEECQATKVIFLVNSLSYTPQTALNESFAATIKTRRAKMLSLHPDKRGDLTASQEFNLQYDKFSETLKRYGLQPAQCDGLRASFSSSIPSDSLPVH